MPRPVRRCSSKCSARKRIALNEAGVTGICMQSARVRPLERCIVALAPGRCGKVRSRRSRCGRPTSRASKRRRTKDPLYFFTVSWSLGEKPTIEQARDAADTYTRKLAIEREREAAAERKAERERNADMAFAIERELRDRGVRTISHEDIFKIMPAVRAAASKIHYGSQTEIMANIVQDKLAPKRSRGMRR